MNEPLKIWIPITFPAMNETLKAARATKGSWSRYSDLKRAYTKGVRLYALDHRRRRIETAHVRFEWHCENRRTDPDNIASAAKYVLDGLVKAGVLADDGFKNVKSIHHDFLVSKEPGVLVVIDEVEER